MAQAKPLHPVILSGGSGTRLWPLSRADYPKQLIPVVGSDSLLQQTTARVADPDRFAAPRLICNEAHRFLVAEQMRQIGTDPAAILLEPVARNTAPAICAAALTLAAEDPEAVMLVLPSDHAIADTGSFLESVALGRAAAEAGHLVTFGMTPQRPETGYGYIRRGGDLPAAPDCAAVSAFVEKPDRATAEAYLADGHYLWNSGMFLMRAADLLDAVRAHQPDVLTACEAAVARAHADLHFTRLDAEAFAKAPAISIDHGVMERTDRAAVVPAEMGWSDVGSWAALWSIQPKDTAGNVAQGDVVAEDAQNCLLHSDGRLLAAVGVRDLIVVATDDAILVCPRDQSERVGAMAKRLMAEGRTEAVVHTQVYRPWGSYQSVDAAPGFQVKRLTVKPGSRLSLQSHRHRAEHWVVVEGEAEITCDGRVFRLYPNQSTYIPCGAVHRLANPGDAVLHVVEVQSGDYLGEDDIQRYGDDFHRT
jgi:mannose-1-phosphate guanylyltransferase/mannose-6-phosphate isomerase